MERVFNVKNIWNRIHDDPYFGIKTCGSSWEWISNGLAYTDPIVRDEFFFAELNDRCHKKGGGEEVTYTQNDIIDVFNDNRVKLVLLSFLSKTLLASRIWHRQAALHSTIFALHMKENIYLLSFFSCFHTSLAWCAQIRVCTFLWYL